MKQSQKPAVRRCAIYTRKSTEHGLELEFNSLHAQREAGEAFIKSQASQGWRLVPTQYEDAAFSGGSLDRPALKRLLADIESGKIDVIIVYKIDRLTRSLADFAKLVELFDKHAVSFVSVTQSFNTENSMGRLTLNVLLSFAQFERELGSERVRDKIAASRKKGKWTGGSISLGYDIVDKKLIINEAEAKTVRAIFTKYLELKSFQRLVNELDQNGIRTKQRNARGKGRGGIPFTYGPLAYLLKNRIYVGESGHNDQWFEGEHEPILDKRLFEDVQELTRTNAVERKHQRQESGALLMGLLFDDRGNRMSPSYSVKDGTRYRFYVSAALLKGRKAEAGSVARVKAESLEDAVKDLLKKRASLPKGTKVPGDVTREHLITVVERIELNSGTIRLILRADADEDGEVVEISFCPRDKNPIPVIDDASWESARPDPKRVHALVRAHAWLRALEDGSYASIEDLAKDADLNPKVVRTAIRLAFLPPDITEAILLGRPAPNFQDLQQALPLSWEQQRRFLNTTRATQQ